MTDLAASILGLVVFLFATTASAQNVPFSEGTVEVKYVTGTITGPKGNPDDPKHPLLRGAGKLGCLETTKDSLVFLLYKSQPWWWRYETRLVHLASTALAKGNCSKDTTGQEEFDIPYAAMVVLARGQVLSGTSQGSQAAQLFTALGGVVGLVTASEKLTGVALGATVAASGATVLIPLTAYLSRKTYNYITIFYVVPCKDSTTTEQSQPDALRCKDSTTVDQSRPDNASQPDPFNRCKNPIEAINKQVTRQAGGCEVVVFQVVDPHDFWNTIRLVSGKAGRQFIPEDSTAGGTGKQMNAN